jgi:hypothetical protein
LISTFHVSRQKKGKNSGKGRNQQILNDAVFSTDDTDRRWLTGTLACTRKRIDKDVTVE